MDNQRTAKAGEFWLTTCGLNTNRRGSPRADTPWNALTAGETALVNTIWDDRVVTVHDPATNTARRFVRLGLVLNSWTPQRKTRAKAARELMDRAFAQTIPIYGFEAAADPVKLARDDERSIQFVHLDRVHRLQPHMGLRGEELIERLKLREVFRQRAQQDDGPASREAIIFELMPPGDAPPGAAREMDRADMADAAHRQPEQELTTTPSTEKVDVETLARRVLPALVEHVARQRDGVLLPITYKDLATRIGRFGRDGEPASRLGGVLTRTTELINQAAVQLGAPAPYFACIVVRSPSAGPDAGLPDEGVREYWPFYESLSRRERRDRVLLEHERILAFGDRWNEILRICGLEPRRGAGGDAGPAPAGSTTGGWGGGESEDHKRLKHHVLKHPELVGATLEFEGEVEHLLRSRDEIDVAFLSPAHWIGAEVKSKVSDGQPEDYDRGVYQVVKYRSVLEAQARIDHPDAPPKVTVFLVLERTLPKETRLIAEALGVPVIESVVPRED